MSGRDARTRGGHPVSAVRRVVLLAALLVLAGLVLALVSEPGDTTRRFELPSRETGWVLVALGLGAAALAGLLGRRRR